MSHKANDIYNEDKFESHVEECGMCHNGLGECIEKTEDCVVHSCEHCKDKVKRQGDLL